MAYSDVFDNHLYERNFFENEILRTLPQIAAPGPIFEELAKIRGKIVAGDAEANLDLTVTDKILDILGWPHSYQQKFKFHGNRKIPDFLLFASDAARDAHANAPADSKPLKDIISIWEDKAENVTLDNGRTDTANPYFQLMEYLNSLRLPFGFLGNGHEFRYVDNSEIFADKRYLAVNFDRLVESRDVNALRVFMGIFGRAAHVAKSGKETPAALLAGESRRRQLRSEEELRNAVYGLDGRESMFEKCGRFLYASLEIKDQSVLTDLYKNCLYLTFRLIFLAFFEDRHRDALARHPGYREISLSHVWRKAREAVENGQGDGYAAWGALRKLFRTLDEGDADLDIPLFNGGLFASRIAAMLDRPKIMDNTQVLELLDMLYGSDGSGFIRDFSSISVIQLGRIYESLLEFEFRIAQENLWYMEYRDRVKGKLMAIDGYFDTEDYENILARLKKAGTADSCRAMEYRKGDVYLVGGKNSRKQLASYYTPQSLSRPLVRAAIDDAVAKLGTDASLLDLKILDNACGSGHLLVECLQYLTGLAIPRLEHDQRLTEVLREEKRRIDQTLADMGVAQYGIEADELAVLKRILLKRTIYGVDLQPFAVELARLGLWIETFVFGTPLSFIEHHVKAGNSLSGSSYTRVRRRLDTRGQGNLLDSTLTDAFRDLENVFRKLSDLQDTTAADITESKEIYYKEILPRLQEMNAYFDLLNTGDMLLAEAAAERIMARDNPVAADAPDEKMAESLKKSADDKEKRGGAILKNYVRLAQDLHDRKHGWQETKDLIAAMRQKYAFFNWHLEFPEVFASGSSGGFHVIIGNPPWDKTKFADTDFFSQYRSNYRQLSNREKLRAARELLAKPFIRQRYGDQKIQIDTANEYFKEHFPHSRGAGDGNLFRFFVEHNLSLLRAGGTLNYVIPTALWTDDGSTELRRLILDKYRLRSFFGFENRELLFPDVHACYKYGLMQVEFAAKKLEPAEKSARTRFMLSSPSQLEEKDRIFTYSMDDIRVTSPDFQALMEMRNRAELDIMRKIHSAGYKNLDPAWLDFKNELHATSDKKIFHEHYAEGMLPLYKGACIWQFDSQYWKRAGEANLNEYWLKPHELDAHLLKKERGRLMDDLWEGLENKPKKSRKKAVLDLLGLKKEEDLDKFIVPDRNFYRLAFRGIARDTDERSVIATVLPQHIGAQHSLWISIPKKYVTDGKNIRTEKFNDFKLFFAQSMLNSIIFDWITRCSIAINVTKSNLFRVPMPQPTEMEIRSNEDYLKLTRNSLRLSAFYNKEAFMEFFPAFGLSASDRITEDKIADMARRENDFITAKLYGLKKADMAIILDTFKVMNRRYPGYGRMLLEMMED